MCCSTALEDSYAGLLPDEVSDLKISRLKRRFQFVELGDEGTQLLLTPAIPVKALRMGLDVALKTLRRPLLLSLSNPGLALLLQGVHVDVVECLKEVEGPMEDRDAMPVGLLRQDAKPLTAGVPLASPLLGEKIVQLMVGVGEFLGLFRPFKETGAMTGERQLFNLAAFVLGPQRTKLSDILHDQCVAAANVIDHPGRSTDKATAQHGDERSRSQVNRHTP